MAAYQNALTAGGDGAANAVAGVLAPDVVVETNFGRAEGPDAVVDLLAEPRTVGLLAAGVRWSEPSIEGDRIVVIARLPDTAPFSGLEFVFSFAGELISRVEQQTLAAAPPHPAELRLTSRIRDAVNDALDNATPMLIAYRDERQEIHLSFRGTIQAYSDDQLALWARDPGGGLPTNITERPEVTLFYHDPARRVSYTFYGRARIEPDHAARTAIFENSNLREQRADFRRRGVAVVVDLDKVEGRTPEGRLLMLRAHR